MTQQPLILCLRFLPASMQHNYRTMELSLMIKALGPAKASQKKPNKQEFWSKLIFHSFY
jgi:hypothetical protein